MRWRAVAGAALVTVAAFGVLFAHRAAQNPPTTRYLVITSTVDAGTTLDAGHLGSVAIDLPHAVDAVPEGHSEDVIGRVAAHTLSASELVSESALLDRDRFNAPGEAEIAVSVDPARTPLGQFATGDRVAVLSSAATGTRELATDARVTRIEGDDSHESIGSVSQIRLGLALRDMDQARAIVDAAVNEELTIALGAPGSGESP